MNLKEFGHFFANNREKSGYESQRQLAIASGVSNGTIARVEGGTQKITPDTLKKLTPFLKSVTYEELMKEAGYFNENISLKEPSSKASKDEKDIAKRMEQIKKDLTNEDGLSFNGEPMSEEAVDSLLEAMEYAVRQTQRINKKYIPKKYRDTDNE